MKKNGQATYITSMVLIGVDAIDEGLTAQANEYSISLHRFDSLIEH